MALSRCLEKHSPPQAKKHRYEGYAKPVRYPNSALICGRCNNPGVIWLTHEEAFSYRKGCRIFDGPNNFARMKADESGIDNSSIL